MGLFRKRTKPVQLRSMDELEPLVASGQPVLLDFFQFNCAPCKVMDGIVNELADEYAGSAHVVKVNVQHVPAAIQEFKIRSTPTFVLLGAPPAKNSKKARRQPERQGRVTTRWRGSGLVKKDFLARQLESNGAVRTAAGS